MKEQKKPSFKKSKAKQKLSFDKAMAKEKDTSEKLDVCQKLKDEYLAGWQRERADFLNYKKEEMERVGELIKYAGAGLVLKFLLVLDNIGIAEKKLPKDLIDNENVKGLLQIKRQIQDILKSQSVEEIETLGKKFDPSFQEIIAEVELDDREPGIVVEEVCKGYKMHGNILRPAKVKVSKINREK